MKLESLTISNVRGYVDDFTLIFEPGRKLCIVYGENGTGKTTLCDALELLGAGTMGSLDDRGLGKTERYWLPATKSKQQTSVVLQAKTEKYEVRVNGAEVTWNGSKPQVHVLRRPQLLRIVTTTAAERYRAIAALVDVSGVEESEATLTALFKETEQSVTSRTNQVTGAREILQRQFASQAGNGDVVEWARAVVAKSPTVDDGAAQAFEKLSNALDALHRAVALAKDKQSALKQAEAQLAAANDAVSVCRSTGASSDAELVGLLDAAAKALAVQHHGDSCPLCESKERAHGLVDRVNRRLEALAALREAIEAQKGAFRVRESAAQRLDDAKAAVILARQSFQKSVTSGGTVVDSIPPQPDDDEQIAGWLEQVGQLKAQWSSRRDKLAAEATQRHQLRDALTAYDENHQLAERATNLLAALKHGLEVARSVRHQFVNGVLGEIAEEVARLYEAVHPGEGLAKISLSLHDKKRASLELATSFQSATSVPPQAYLSDSHLDTLGLCVFIALAKRQGPQTILVLDDVLASVDEPHVDRLIEMIGAEAQHFRHVIVTTHYRPWREKLRWGWLKQSQCQLVELGRWEAGKGASLVRNTGEIERLRKQLSLPDGEFDVQVVCSKAGVVLEAILDFLTELYELKLPRKPRDAWTLGDLLPAVGKKLRTALRVEKRSDANPDEFISYQVGPLLDELSQIAQTRNLLGAHFSKFSFELLDSDAKKFAEKVLVLADLLVHPEHGWPRNKKSGSHWSSGQDARRLHPLVEPQ